MIFIELLIDPSSFPHACLHRNLLIEISIYPHNVIFTHGRSSSSVYRVTSRSDTLSDASLDELIYRYELKPLESEPQRQTANTNAMGHSLPGNLGNRLEAKIDKPTLVHWMCYRKTEDWFPLWIDLNMFMPIGIDHIRIVYNRTTRNTSNAPGVEVRVPGFGQTHPIDYFSKFMSMAIHAGMCYSAAARTRTGYNSPNRSTYYKCTVVIRNKTKIFDLYAISGENDGIPFVSNIKICEEQRMTSTNPWMIPSEEAWSSDHTFISTPFFNYTNQDYQQFFKDINFEDGWYMWEDSKNLTAGLPSPGVEVYCLYGVGLPTPVTYGYDEQFPIADPIDIIYDDGDDTVGSRSMSLCKRWMEKQEQAVHVTEFRGMAHLDMVFNHKLLGCFDPAVGLF
uniref:Lecithin-cholesterol acyltransferase n=1 Tax=Sinocyclocheilus grahami TaxID=75366 RepID=A0A672RAX5_SINGR